MENTPSTGNRAWCSNERITAAIGLLILITGIALFIIQGLHVLSNTSLLPAAKALSGIGFSLFSLSFLSYACRGGCDHLAKKLEEADNANRAQPRGNAPQPRGNAPQRGVVNTPPLDRSISTKSFFESKGVFGVPDELIDYLDTWRAFRAGSCQPPPDAGFLLSGPSGCGKTKIASLIHELLGGTTKKYASRQLISSVQGETERKITEVFTIPDGEFCVITIDEIDGLLRTRNPRATDQINSGFVNHFLSVVQGNIDSDKPRPYILIGTTNLSDNIDKDVLRDGRIGKHFFIPLPNMQTCSEILNFQFQNFQFQKYSFGYQGSNEPLNDSSKMVLFAAIASSLAESGKNSATILSNISELQQQAQLNQRPHVIYLEEICKKFAIGLDRIQDCLDNASNLDLIQDCLRNEKFSPVAPFDPNDPKDPNDPNDPKDPDFPHLR